MVGEANGFGTVGLLRSDGGVHIYAYGEVPPVVCVWSTVLLPAQRLICGWRGAICSAGAPVSMMQLVAVHALPSEAVTQ